MPSSVTVGVDFIHRVQTQYPFLVEPHLTIAHAAPPPTLRLLVLSLLLGSVLLFPVLLYLYRIFKGRVLPGR